jgi:hypothetical protein
MLNWAVRKKLMEGGNPALAADPPKMKMGRVDNGTK